MIEPRGQAVATAALMMTAYTRCQATGPKPAASSRRVDPPLGARLAGPAEDQRRDEPSGELIDQNEMATGDQNPVALGQSRLLVRPVIERGHADHQVERAVPERQVLGHADREPQPLVAGNEQGRGRGDLDHSRRRVDPRQFGGARAAAGQQPEQIAAPAADIEHSLGRRAGGQGDLGGLVGDVMMKPAEPSLVITGGPLLEGGHIAVPGWRGIAGHLNRQPRARQACRTALRENKRPRSMTVSVLVMVSPSVQIRPPRFLRTK